MILSDPLTLQIWYADRHCQVLTTHKMYLRKGRSFGHVTVFSISVQWLSLLSHTRKAVARNITKCLLEKLVKKVHHPYKI